MASVTLEIDDELGGNCEAPLIETLPNISTYLEQNGDLGVALEPFSILNPEDISYSDFYRNYLVANRPCLFTRDITNDWEAISEWTISEEVPTSYVDDRNLPAINFDFLITKYGHNTVSVTDCDKQGSEYDNAFCESMSLGNYIKYFREYSALGHPSTQPCLYLKDWHIVSNHSCDEPKPYEVPKFFASDWLNETASEQGDDFRFAYIGPKGSWTPFHADVYGSFSWSANVIGRKKWFLYPPGNEKKFLKRGKIQFDPENPGVINRDFYEVLQESGQIIYVPSGWFHIVWNLEDTISINHNWINAANLGYIWGNLKSAMADVQNELRDLESDPEFHDLCQGLLKANHGMNYVSFLEIISTIEQNRKDGINYNRFTLGPKHVKYDLSAIKSLLTAIKSYPSVSKLVDTTKLRL